MILEQKISHIIIFLFSLISLTEIGIQFQGDGISIGYFYIFLPFILILFDKNRQMQINKDLLYILTILFVIFLVGYGDITNSSSSEFRRIGSFFTMIFPFAIAFLNPDKQDLYSFKLAVVISCLLYSLINIFDLIEWVFFIGADYVDLKGKIGSQRYGFILLLGFYIVLLDKNIFYMKGVWIVMLKYVSLVVIFFGLMLTYSKTTIISLIFTSLILLLSSFKHTLKLNYKKMGFYAIIFLILSYFLLLIYKEQLIHVLSFDYRNFESSLGERVNLINLAFIHLSENPFFGSSYRGIYVLFDHLNGGSAHNQYLDIILRTGIVGLVIFLYLFFKILYKLSSLDKGLFFGFISILLVGFMHETFKLSWGSFVFGFILAAVYSKNLYSETNNN